MSFTDHEERWFGWWEDDDGFNIKEGPRQDNIDIFFLQEKAADAGNENFRPEGAEAAEADVENGREKGTVAANADAGNGRP